MPNPISKQIKIVVGNIVTSRFVVNVDHVDDCVSNVVKPTIVLGETISVTTNVVDPITDVNKGIASQVLVDVQFKEPKVVIISYAIAFISRFVSKRGIKDFVS